MSASQVEIINNALSLIGDSAITSIDDNTVRARLANQFYNVTLDAVLRAHPWNCAVSRAALGKLAAAPVFGWDSQFQLPSDPYCLRVLALNDNEEWADPGDTFKIEGRNLLSNTATAKIRFIQRITDPGQFDTLLYEALSARLAAKMAYPVTGSVSVATAMMNLYQGFLKDARTVDGQEGSPDRSDVTTLLDIR